MTMRLAFVLLVGLVVMAGCGDSETAKPTGGRAYGRCGCGCYDYG